MCVCVCVCVCVCEIRSGEKSEDPLITVYSRKASAQRPQRSLKGQKDEKDKELIISLLSVKVCVCVCV